MDFSATSNANFNNSEINPFTATSTNTVNMNGGGFGNDSMSFNSEGMSMTTNSIYGNKISNIVDHINTLSEQQHGGGVLSDDSAADYVNTIVGGSRDLEGGARELPQSLKDNNAFTKQIKNATGIDYFSAAKVNKHYRDLTKENNLNDQIANAKKLFNDDVKNGKINDVVKKVTGKTASRSKGKKSNKSNKKGSKKNRKTSKRSVASVVSDSESGLGLSEEESSSSSSSS